MTRNVYHLLPGDEAQIEFENGMSIVIEHRAGALGLLETSGHIICIAPKSPNYLLAFPQYSDYREAPAAEALAHARAGEQAEGVEFRLRQGEHYGLYDCFANDNKADHSGTYYRTPPADTRLERADTEKLREMLTEMGGAEWGTDEHGAEMFHKFINKFYGPLTNIIQKLEV